MDWKLKALGFRVLAAVPSGNHLHFLLQRHVTRTWPRRAATIEALVGAARMCLDDFVAHSRLDPAAAVFLEIGAGRDLVVPISLRLMGVGQVVTIDIERLASLDLVQHAANMVAGILEKPAPQFRSWDDVKAFGIDYRAPLDLTRESLDGERVDAFVSNEVLEHIPEPVLVSIFDKVAKLLAPDGLFIHSIDYTDHYARGSTISRHNFLVYDDAEWSKYQSSFQYVNRLRHSQYCRIFDDAGLKIVQAKTKSIPVPDEVRSNLAAKFREFDIEDLQISSSRIVAVRA